MPNAREGYINPRGTGRERLPERGSGPGRATPHPPPPAPGMSGMHKERQGRRGSATLFNDNSLISVSSYSKGQHERRGGQCISILTHVLVHNPTGPGGPECPCPSAGGDGGLSSFLPRPAVAASQRETWGWRDAELAEQRGTVREVQKLNVDVNNN